MKFQAILASGLALAGFAVAAPAPASAVVPDPSQVYIQSISYGGTGCPQGTVGISLSADKTTFTLIFDEYVASVGPGVSVIENRKNCQINVNLHYPSGFQYSILGVDARGFVALDKGVTATQKTTYYFSGEQIQASTQTDFTGPVSKDYLIHDEIPFTSTVWAPCGQVQALNINSQVRLANTKNSSGSGLLTTDSVDGKVTFVVGVNWQTCKN